MRSIVLILVFIPSMTFSQSITRNLVSVASNSETNENINLSYSIGEVIIPTVIQENRALTQGFQQPEIIVHKKNDELFGKLYLKCYPNPVFDYLHIQISNFRDHYTIVLRVFDTRGSEVDHIERKLTDRSDALYSFDFTELMIGLYFVHIIIDNYYAANFNFYKAQE